MKTIKHVKDILRGKTVIVGLGNSLQKDDGVGPAVIEELRKTVETPVINAMTALENFIDPLLKIKPDTVIIIDAVRFSGKPGEVRLFSGNDFAEYRFSTHGMSPVLFVTLLEQSGISNIHIIGIQPESTSLGEGLSRAVTVSADMVISTLKRLLKKDAGIRS